MRFPSAVSLVRLRCDYEISSARYIHNFLLLQSLTALVASTTLDVLNRSNCWHRGGEFFAETHVSTESAPSPQDTRVSHAHEDCRGPQSTGGSTQKGTPSSYAHLEIRTRLEVVLEIFGWVFPVQCVCLCAWYTKPYTAPVSAARVLSFPFSSVRKTVLSKEASGRGPARRFFFRKNARGRPQQPLRDQR